MSSYPYSICILVPAAAVDNANRLAVAMGWDGAPLPGRTFVAAASSDGTEPATHRFCRFQARQGFVDTFTAALGGGVPDEPAAGGAWSDYGLTTEAVADVLAAFTVDLAHVSGAGGLRSIDPASEGAKHWRDVLDENGLARV